MGDEHNTGLLIALTAARDAALVYMALQTVGAEGTEELLQACDEGIAEAASILGYKLVPIDAPASSITQVSEDDRDPVGGLTR